MMFTVLPAALRRTGTLKDQADTERDVLPLLETAADPMHHSAAISPGAHADEPGVITCRAAHVTLAQQHVHHHHRDAVAPTRPVTNDGATACDWDTVLRDVAKAAFRGTPPLHIAHHIAFVQRSIVLPGEVQYLEASHPWMLYWLVHAADLMGALPLLFADGDSFSDDSVDGSDDPGQEVAQRAITASKSILASRVLPTLTRKAVVDYLIDGVFTVDEDPSCDEAEPIAALTTALESGVVPHGERRGFGGAPGHLPHLASSYAAVCALCIVSNGEKGYLGRLDRPALTRWLLSLREPDGSFRMSRSGEVDVRASYCVAAIASLLGLPMQLICPPICTDFLRRCQTFEGGYGSGCHGPEAHGGYTQCGSAALVLMYHHHSAAPAAIAGPVDRVAMVTGSSPAAPLPAGLTACMLRQLRLWCALRQQAVEGGFCGRTNKLVDACYTWWVGGAAAAAIVSAALLVPSCSGTATSAPGGSTHSLLRHAQLLPHAATHAAASTHVAPPTTGEPTVVYDAPSLTRYVLRCCQPRLKNSTTPQGGLVDKPGCYVDFYHTCYSLSGLSAAQEVMTHPKPAHPSVFLDGNAPPHDQLGVKPPPPQPPHDPPFTAGHVLLRGTNPLVNICRDRVSRTLRLFGKLTL